MKPAHVSLLIRHFGVTWIFQKLWKSSSEKIGYWKWRLPSRDYESFDSLIQSAGSDRSLLESKRFLFSPQDLSSNRKNLLAWDPDTDWSEETLQQIERGEFLHFSDRRFQRGWPPNWFEDPYTNQAYPAKTHFSQVNEFGESDVKAVWELSRFGFAFELSRAFARTGDDRCAELFWQLFEDWLAHNPPYRGINWKCGQESGLRLLATTFAVFAFSGSKASTPNRMKAYLRFACATGHRIYKHLGYAISQKNNHGISESATLWIISVLFPELTDSKKWRTKGEKVLAGLCDELIYNDGGFSQHSLNYHRLVLHTLAYVIRIAQQNEIKLDTKIESGFRRAAEFLTALVDQQTGLAPRLGNDDGAMLLPLTHCDYSDFRPTIQLCHVLAHQEPFFEPGPWDETLYWFGLDRTETSKPDVAKDEPIGVLRFDTSGVYQFRNENFLVTVKAGKFKHRPTQSDQMHVDLFFKQQNIAIDPGTYSYNGSGIWKSIPLMDASCHNTITVNGKEPDERAAKFVILPWNVAELEEIKEGSDANMGEWYRSLEFGLPAEVFHRRAIKVDTDQVIVIDGLWSDVTASFSLHWLLGAEPSQQSESESHTTFEIGTENKLALDVFSSESCETSLVCGDPNSPRGWMSPRYLSRVPAHSLVCTSQGKNVVFVSRFRTSDQQFGALNLNPIPTTRDSLLPFLANLEFAT